jgi:hypothetical protein
MPIMSANLHGTLSSVKTSVLRSYNKSLRPSVLSASRIDQHPLLQRNAAISKQCFRKYQLDNRRLSTSFVTQSTFNNTEKFNLAKAVRSYVALESILKQNTRLADVPYFLSDAKVIRDTPVAHQYAQLYDKWAQFVSGTTDYPRFLEAVKVDGKDIIERRICENEEKITLSHDVISTLTTSLNSGMVSSGISAGLKFITADRLDIKYEEGFRYLKFQLQQYAPTGTRFVFKLQGLSISNAGTQVEQTIVKQQAPNHYATLIVTLPTNFEGGHLILNSGGINMTIPTSSPENRYTYAVLLNEVPYELTRQFSGTRAALEYDMYLEDKKSMVGQADDSEADCETFYELESYWRGLAKSDYEIYPKLARPSQEFIFNQSDFLSGVQFHIDQHPQNPIAFMLQHSYPKPLLDISELQSCDKQLYDVLSSKYEVKLGYAINTVQTCQEGYPEHNIGTKNLQVTTFDNLKGLQKYVEYGSKSPFNPKTSSEIDRTSPHPCHVFVGSSAKFLETEHWPYNTEFGDTTIEWPLYIFRSWVLVVGPEKRAT